MKAFFLVLVFMAAGCTGGVIVEHARAARMVAPVLTAAHAAIDRARDVELDECETLPVAAEREPCLDAGIHRWAPAVLSYNLAREGWLAWLEAMQLASIAGTSDADATAILVPLALALIRLYDGIVEALEPFEEVDIPDFPGLSIMGGE